MNKKNITYCSLAILSIVVVSITANQKDGSTNSRKSSMSMNIESNDTKIEERDIAGIRTKANVAQKEVINSIASSKAKETIFVESDKYSKTDINRALMYQKKSWAKDETINENAWEASQKIDGTNLNVAKNPKPLIEKQQKTTPALNTTNTKDGKDNSAMVE